MAAEPLLKKNAVTCRALDDTLPEQVRPTFVHSPRENSLSAATISVCCADDATAVGASVRGIVAARLVVFMEYDGYRDGGRHTFTSDAARGAGRARVPPAQLATEQSPNMYSRVPGRDSASDNETA